ncbi:hypothetical protein ACHAWF_012266 [Thalassiosira exigua]
MLKRKCALKFQEDVDSCLLPPDPRAAVAAAASSPHRSTVNPGVVASRRDCPSQDYRDDEWHDNGRSRLGLAQGSRRARDGVPARRPHPEKSEGDRRDDDRRGGRSPVPWPPRGPVPGSADDPAVVSRDDFPAATFRCDVDDEDRDDDGHRDACLRDRAPRNADFASFARRLRADHDPPLEVVPMDGDGNCLFRAVSLQVYGDPDLHAEVRGRVLDFMEREEDHFRPFVAADGGSDDDEGGEGRLRGEGRKGRAPGRDGFVEYVARKRADGVHGDHAEVQAASELYGRRVEVYVPGRGIEPINIFHAEYGREEGSGGKGGKRDDTPPIRLCYADGNHYDAVIDPLVPTAGVGLGMPGLRPGLADRMQVEEAKRISDESFAREDEGMQRAIEESGKADAAREEAEVREALRRSGELLASSKTEAGSDDDALAKKAAYLSEIEAAEEAEVREALRRSGELVSSKMAAEDDVYAKKAMYLSEIEAADFDLEQAVLASSLESFREAEQERKPPSSRRGEGRNRGRYSSSPRGLRSSSNSPVYQPNQAASALSAAACSSSDQYAVAPIAPPSSSAASNLLGVGAGTAAAGVGLAGGATTATDEYPPSVQELVMNGFELSRVLRAYDLIGDNFDDLLSFLLSST